MKSKKIDENSRAYRKTLSLEDEVLAEFKDKNKLGMHKIYVDADPDTPIKTAVAIQRFGNSYSLVEYKLQGPNIIEVFIDQPTTKPIAIDSFKAKAQTTFMD